MNPSSRNLFGFWLFSLIYSANSYLLLTRDAFLLERLSLALNLPWIETSGASLAQTIHANSLPTLFLAISFLGLFYFFIKLLSVKLTFSAPNIFLVTLILTTFTLSFPILSTDVFDYININRVTFVHHANPWTAVPSDFPSDSLIYFGSWIDRASPYPPLTHVLFAPIQLLSGNSITANIFGFKLLNLVFLLSSAWVLFKHKIVNNPKINRAAFFLFNPLILIEFLGNAHNDIIMAFFTLLSIILIHKKRAYLSAFFLSLAFLSKISIIIYLPLILLYLLTNTSLKSAVKYFLAFLVSIAIGLLPLAQISSAFLATLSTQTSTYLRSLPTILRFFFSKTLPPGQDALAINFQKLTTTPVFLAAVLYLATKIKKHSLTDLLIITMIAHLLIASPMIQPWYLIWFLPLVSLSASKRLVFASIVFSLSSLSHYLILFVSFYFSPLNFSWQIIMYLAITIPVIIALFAPKKWYTNSLTDLHL